MIALEEKTRACTHVTTREGGRRARIVADQALGRRMIEAIGLERDRRLRSAVTR
ncbi:MAG: hypothetical protein KF819_00130 [Labilithrix sp.]|nr:hypothetical protein [Labilithrix sp.]